VFRISAPPKEGRCEPTLDDAPRLTLPDALPLDAPERVLSGEARERTRWYGPVGSLVVHLLPLLLLIEWPLAAPPEFTPIAVQLVVEPPPPEPPPPVPPPKPATPKPEFKPPPPGPIASEDLGDTEAKKASREAGNPPPPQEAAQPTPPQKIEPPPNETPPQDAGSVPPPPPEKPEPPKPQPKPTQTAQLAPRRVQEPTQTSSHPAKYPGPAATRDEYLAYVHSLIRRHYNLLPLSMVGGRRGETLVEFIVLDDGTIAMIKVRQSSGYPDIDERIEQMVLAVRRLPPLPQWFQGPSMGLILSLPFPDALRE
jgi:TonB family protein